MSSTYSTEGSTVQYRIYLGFWTNWSRGSVFGSTLTLTRDNGNLLIALTAFFVGWVSARFWKLICVAFHRYYSTQESRDGFHHQRQAILRNSATADSGIVDFGDLYWTWRRSAGTPLLRILPTLICAVICTCAFAVASTFSSQVSTGIGNEVLIDGAQCGLINSINSGTVPANVSAMSSARIARQINNAANYVQQCYTSDTGRSSVFDCTSYVAGRLPAITNSKATCPFKDGICRSNTSNLILDTGYIDSHVHLGVNAPPDMRILFRNVYQCAPLRTDGFTSEEQGQRTNYTRYHYGNVLRGPIYNRTMLNYSYEVNTLDSQYSSQSDNAFRTASLNFRLVYQNAAYFNGSFDVGSDFIPIPSLDRPDAELSIHYLSGNGIYFNNPSNDDWYRASVPGPTAMILGINGSTTVYQPEEAASPLACLSQFQFCNPMLPSDKQCGPLTGLGDAVLGSSTLFNLPTDVLLSSDSAEDKRASQYFWFINVISLAAFRPSNIVMASGAKVLVSQQTLQSGFQGPLADDQWKLDVTNWWSMWLASLQSAFVTTASGPQEPALQVIGISPADAAQREICNNQMVQSADFTSFSVFGLFFIFLTGITVIVVSYTLDPLFNYLVRRHKYKDYKQLEWTANGTLGLQRLGFQVLGRGTWPQSASDIPLAKTGDKFRSLAIEAQNRQGGGKEGKIQLTLVDTTTTSSTSSRSQTFNEKVAKAKP
ncbi:hypothetical protein GQ53DRAFT_847088 [Thozetella sp. PMI_491]|nr:hypothetical protein GQ53DRAFT_847088 [Thozetella sp. PMI_491]